MKTNLLKSCDKWFKQALLVAAAVLLLGCGADEPGTTKVDAKESIKIGFNDWTGQNLSAKIIEALLQEKGYATELVTAGTVPQLAAMAQGEIHLNPNFWDNNIDEAYTKAVASGDIVIVGPLGLKPQEGWIYPKYMKSKCPGLPSFEALYNCAQAFATPETFPKGRVLAYPASWGTRTVDVVKAVNLPFVAVPGGSDGAMVAEMKSAIRSKEPILMMFWQPHSLFAEIDVDWVQWPSSGGECVEETQTRSNACGFAQANVFKIASKDLATKWPGAAKIFANLSISNAQQNAMIFEVDEQKVPIDEVVAKWMRDNRATWEKWL